jgi:hypothetical protein
MTGQKLHIDSASGKTYLSALDGNRGMVALLGSGVSMWHPSNLPNGQRITQELATIMASSATQPKGNTVGFIKRSAFEHIMERYPKPQLLQGIVARAFYPTDPNPVHLAFAQLMNKGMIEHIITTNYDEGLERACSTVCRPSRMPQVIVTELDGAQMVLNHPSIFKIHGCAKPGRESSLVVTLREEGEMPAWKRTLLGRLINGKALLVCGYSGLDFEVCPELVHLRPMSVIWNSYDDPSIKPEALTPNAKRVLSALNGDVLVGDMKMMLEEMGQSCQAGFSTASPSFVQSLVNGLDPWEMDRWRVWVLNGVSCASEAITVASRMCANSIGSDDRRLDSLLALAEAQFHNGLYKQAGATYGEATSLARNSPDWDKRLKAELGVIESNRVAGYWFRALRKIAQLAKTLPQQAPPEAREKVESALALKRVLFRRYPFYLSKLLRLRSFSQSIQAKASQEMALVAAYSAKHGNWFDLQHCEMLACKFQIPLSKIYPGTTSPLASHAGYRHLGYFVGELMAYRNLITDPGISNPQLNVEYLELAQEAGINPEVWKLARAMKKRFGKQALPNQMEQDAKKAWLSCEHTLPMRLLLLLRGEEA